MAYSISYSFVKSDGTACPKLYIREANTNPTTIEAGSSVDLSLIADGTFYQLPAKLKIKVTGATKGDYVKNTAGTSAVLTISNPTADVVITVVATPRVIELTNGPFISTNQTPIDPRFVLSKAQMPLVDDATQPDRYMCVCREDARMYIYKKEADFDEVLGRFRPLEVYLDFSEGQAKESFQKALEDSELRVDGGEITE